MATPFNTLISKENEARIGAGATSTGKVASTITKAPVVVQRQTLDFGTGGAAWETTVAFGDGGPGETVTFPGFLTLTFGG